MPEVDPTHRTRLRRPALSKSAYGLFPCLTALLLLGLSFFSNASAFNLVILDPGHGAHDRGGSSSYVYEKHLALDTARRVQVLLNRAGIRSIITRNRDHFVTLPGRTAISNRYSNALVVSIHYNWSSNRDARGIETFYYNRESYAAAAWVQAYMLNRTRAPNRGVKHGTFYVLRNSTRNPTILVEGGFVSNPHERGLLKTGAYRNRIAEGIAQGIVAYKRTLSGPVRR